MPRKTVEFARKHPVAVKAKAVAIDYPQVQEAIRHPEYSLRLTTVPEAASVEVSIDGGDWRPCREAVGHWWYDWSGFSNGRHELMARVRKTDGDLAVSPVRETLVEL